MLVTVVTLMATLLALGACNKNYTVTVHVTLDVSVKNYNGHGDDLYGKVVVGLFGNTVPVASLNFKTLCEGFKRPNEPTLSYRKTVCHRLVKDMVIQCGDVFNQEGHGTTSIYGQYFNDENFIISHRSAGIVSMANKGKDTNGSQFFVTYGPCRFLDGKHVAFGKVISGLRYLAAINRMGPEEKGSAPKRPVRIEDCNVADVQDYELSDKEFKTDDIEGIVSM